MTEENKAGLSRRTVLKGAAWSVPVVAAAVAVPMAAASHHEPDDQLDFFLTAGEVIGLAGSSGQIRSNGVRISPADPSNPLVVPAGTLITIHIQYHGSNPAVDFTNPEHGTAYNVGQNAAWDTVEYTPNSLTLTKSTPFATSEPTVGSFSWFLPVGIRPENDSITFTGTAQIPAGGDFPEGGTLVSLLVDPNAGTGGLAGPTDDSWPV